MTQIINPKGDEQNYNRQLLPEVSATSAAENISIGRTSRTPNARAVISKDAQSKQQSQTQNHNSKHDPKLHTSMSSAMQVVYYKHFDRLTLLHFTQQVCTLH